MTDKEITIEEAIEYNKNLREYMRITDKKSKYKFLEENYVALDMAIRALEVVQGMEEVFYKALPELDMRDATEEERSALKRYIDSIILLNAYNESRFDGYSDYCAVSDLVADLPSIKDSVK